MTRNKYRVAPVEQRTYNGIVFHSKKEMQCYLSFALLLEHGKIKSLDRQVPFVLSAFNFLGNSEPICKYIADFVIIELDGTRRIYDAKGYKTSEYRTKKKWFEACYGERIVEL